MLEQNERIKYAYAVENKTVEKFDLTLSFVALILLPLIVYFLLHELFAVCLASVLLSFILYISSPDRDSYMS